MVRTTTLALVAAILATAVMADEDIEVRPRDENDIASSENTEHVEDPAMLNDLFSMFGNMGGGQGDQGGDAVCDEGLFPAPINPLHTSEAMVANGCGPQGLQMPDEFGLEVCCNNHDVCYAVCGTSFQKCEKKFKKCMKKLCTKKYRGEQKKNCMQSAQTFGGLTGMLGAGMHSGWQKRLCKCFETKEEAYAQHLKTLTELYEHLASKGASVGIPAEKAEQNLQKYEGKEGELYVKLIRKYGVEYELVKFDNVREEL